MTARPSPARDAAYAALRAQAQRTASREIKDRARFYALHPRDLELIIPGLATLTPKRMVQILEALVRLRRRSPRDQYARRASLCALRPRQGAPARTEGGGMSDDHQFNEPGVAMPREAFLADPRVNWKHIDGPLLTWAGRLHWLALRERFALWFGATTIEAIAQKRWPERRFWYAEARMAAP
jgi:hypothetical protein